MANVIEKTFFSERDAELYLDKLSIEKASTDMKLVQYAASIPMSASRIESYKKCPQAFKRTYLQGEKGVATDAMIIGNLLHTVLETYAGSEEACTVDDMMLIVEGTLSKEEAKTEEKLSEELKETVRTIAEGYWEDIDKQKTPIGVEVPFSLPLGFATFRGVIDKITLLQENPMTIEIRDYKSSKKALSENEMKKNLQMGIYTRAAKQAFPDAVIITVLDYIRLKKQVKHIFAEEELKQIEKDAIDTINKIHADQKFPTLSFKDKKALVTCAFCGHNTKCGVGKRQRQIWESIERKRAKNEV